MTAQGVNRLGSLLDEKMPCLQEHHARLAIDCLDRYETHGWSRYRLADRFCIDRIGLAAFDVWLHVGRRDQSHVVAERGEFAGLEVRPTTGFKTHTAARKSIEEPDNFGSAKLPFYRHRAIYSDTVNLKDLLGYIEPNSCSLVHGTTSFSTTQSAND
jgi:hypothetical protein